MEPALVWDDSLLDYDFGSGHPFNPVRLELTIRLARALGVLTDVTLLSPDPATDDELLRVHTPTYLKAVRCAPDEGPDAVHGLGTDDNPVFPGMHDASAVVVGSTLLAARELAAGRPRAVSIAGGLHHAKAAQASGFCVYNDCAVAVSWLLDHGFDRIAYLDTDVHHGDGVQTAFYDDPRVLTISLHQHPFTLWPGTGYTGEVGHESASGTAVNIPLPPGTADSGWLRACHAVVPSLLAGFGAQVLVTQCGVDSHREDPLADLSLSVDGHRAIYRMMRDFAERYAQGRWLAVGGGGYQLARVVPRSWSHLLATVLDRDLPADTAIPGEWSVPVGRAAPEIALPSTMSDGGDCSFRRWQDGGEDPVDVAIRDARRAVFPLHGLDPDDPRD